MIQRIVSMTTALFALAAVLFVTPPVCAATPAVAPAATPGACPITPSDDNKLTQVKGNVWTWAHGLWIATFVVTNDGIILMDPLNRKAAAWFKAEAKKQFNKEVRYLINSHGHCDHAEGGEIFDKATVIAQENIVDEYKAENVPARYPDVTYRDHMTLRLGGEAVELYHFGNDHGKALSYLYHPATKILVTVDVMARERLPYRELPYDDPQATIDTFNELEKLDVDLIIPGHGNIATKADIARERAYWQLLRAAVTAHIVNGRTLDEIKQLVPQQMAAYSGWQMFKEWGPFNIEGMHRILLKQGVKVAN